MPVGFAARGPLALSSVVAAAPNVLFGANLWAWHEASAANFTLTGTNIDTWFDTGAAGTRHVNKFGDGVLWDSAGAGGAGVVDFVNASNAYLTTVSTLNNLDGKTQVSVFLVASMESPTPSYGRLGPIYCSTNVANDYDAGSSTLGIYRNDTANEVFWVGASAPYAVTLGQLYHFGIVRNGTTTKFYVNGALVETNTSALSLAGTTGTERLTIGAGITVGGGFVWWDGKCGESVIVVDYVPTDGDVASLHAHYATKYGIV